MNIAELYPLSSEKSLRFVGWLDSLRGIDEVSFLAWDDPAPAALMLLAELREMFSRGISATQRTPPFEMNPTGAVAERQPSL